MGTRLFVGNLSYNVNEQELKEAFISEGIEVRSVKVALDRESGRPRGFAFVETMTDEGAKLSIEKVSGKMLQGRAIVIEEAQARPAGPRPGRSRRPARCPASRRLRRSPGAAPSRRRRLRRRRARPRPGGGFGGPPASRWLRRARPVRAASAVRPVPAASRPVVARPGGRTGRRARQRTARAPGKEAVDPRPRPRNASVATGAGTERSTRTTRPRTIERRPATRVAGSAPVAAGRLNGSRAGRGRRPLEPADGLVRPVATPATRSTWRRTAGRDWWPPITPARPADRGSEAAHRRRLEAGRDPARRGRRWRTCRRCS